MKYLMVERARVLQPSIFKMPTESIVHWVIQISGFMVGYCCIQQYWWLATTKSAAVVKWLECKLLHEEWRQQYCKQQLP